MNEGPPTEQPSSLPFQEACDWFVRLREEPESRELVAEWLSWCRREPRNHQAFEHARETWLTLGLIPEDEIARVLSVGGSMGAIASDASPPSLKLRTVRMYSVTAVFAVAAAIVGICWLLIRAPAPVVGKSEISLLATARSEHRSFKLTDGSEVEMAGESKLRVSLSKQHRDIDLLQGEAYFSVAHDKTRPFIVHAGSLHVRAVGTRFDVRTATDRVVVAVEEGVVVVEPPPKSTGAIISLLSTLRALEGDEHSDSQPYPVNVRGGQEVAVKVPDHEFQLVPIEPTAVASWREGRLRFAREPLRSVVQSIRAMTGQDIELADSSLGELRFTGTVFSSGIAAWVRALPTIFPVTVHQEGSRFVIAHRVAQRV